MSRDRRNAVRTYYYGCGSYIRKGRSVCRFGAVGQETLEQAVVETVLDYYRRYAGETGRRKLSEAIMECVNAESADAAKTKRAAERRLKEIEAGITRLRDAMTESIRRIVQERIEALGKKRHMLERQLQGLEDLKITRAERLSLTEECRAFLRQLDDALRSSSQQLRVRTIRRCIEGILVDQEAHAVQVRIRELPVPSLSNMRCEAVSRVLSA